jgi:multidrug efflux system outer membrane protein
MSRALSTRGALAAAASATLLLLGGCESLLPPGGRTAPPVLELPQKTSAPQPVAVDWWNSFKDPVLSALVTEALQNNSDLGRAVARIDESRALLALSHSFSLPAVTANFSGERQRVTETGTFNQGTPTRNNFRAALDMSYELDLWGRLRKADDAARAELLAESSTRDTLIGVIAVQVVQAYASLQSLDERRRLYGAAVDAERESLALQRLRVNAGEAGELDLRQLEGQFLTNAAQLPRLDRERGETERALAILLGRSPRAVIEQAITHAPQAATLQNLPAVPSDLPSDLLAHRADVQAAEARLAAAGARVDVARATYFPRINLTASLGRESADLSRLFDGPSLIWSVLASATQPIWAGGQLRAQSDVARARERIAELDYRDSVAAAFSDARNALVARSESAETLALAQQRSVALVRAAELTRLRYNGGEASRFLLIDAERDALTSQALEAEARRALVVAHADVFRALGSGWTATPP